MNKTLLYTLIAALTVVLSSCDKYLDIKPVGKVIPTTAEDFRAIVTQAYSYVPSDRGLASFRSDEVSLDPSMSEYDIESYFDIWAWKDNGANANTATFSWRSFYHVLFIANYVIESEAAMTGGSNAEIRQMVGEAYMLRAYMHFVLANLHAPAYTKCDPATTKAVPLKLSSDVETLLGRSMLGDIYKSVTDDIDTAETYLNVDSWETGYNYRFNKLSVDALRSRVYLYMGKWDESLAAAKRVLAVNDNLADMTSELPNVYTSVENIVALEDVLTNNYARAMRVNSDFLGMYGNDDLRRDAYYDTSSSSGARVRKGGSNTYSCTLRVGEIILNAAESAWNAHEYGEAADYLLQLQSARYTPAGYAAKESYVRGLSPEALLAEIYDERGRELAFEGHRWFDLRRTTMPRIERKFGNEVHVLEQGDSRYTIPIPTAAIQANPMLTQ